MYFYTFTQKIMDKKRLEKHWISLVEFKKMQEKVDDTYYNLCELGLYGDIYYKLQELHGYLDDFVDGEYLDEDELDEIWLFYENHYKN